MKAIKCICLYFIYPCLMLVFGFWGGVKTARFFYPGGQTLYLEEPSAQGGALRQSTGQGNNDAEAVETAQRAETLSVETEYVLEETDVLRGSVVESVLRLPGKYVGMNREQFLDAMKVYESSPPLSELERGFIGLNVLAFSRERVVVQMNYRYLQPGQSFYLVALDNEVVVCLDDMQTVYIYTGILLDNLPQPLQDDIIKMMFVEDEEKLYNFLETYSS